MLWIRRPKITKESLSPRNISELRKATRDAHKHPECWLTYFKPDHQLLHFQMYADASCASNDEISSQIWYLILLCDKTGSFHVLDFPGRKSKRVVRSTVQAKLNALTNAADVFGTIAVDISYAFAVITRVRMLNNTRQVFGNIKRGQQLSEKIREVDVTAARQAYQRI